MRYGTVCPAGVNYRMRVHPASGSGIIQASWNEVMQGSCQPSSRTAAAPDCLETGQSASTSSRDWTEAAVLSEKAGREMPEAFRLGPEATRVSRKAPIHGAEASRLTPEAFLETKKASKFPPEAPGDRTEAVIAGEKGVRKSKVHASGVSLTASRVAPAPLDVNRGEKCGAGSA